MPFPGEPRILGSASVLFLHVHLYWQRTSEMSGIGCQQVNSVRGKKKRGKMTRQPCPFFIHQVTPDGGSVASSRWLSCACTFVC